MTAVAEAPAKPRTRRKAKAAEPEPEDDGRIRHEDPAGMTLGQIEAFCADLRAAGAADDCPVWVREVMCRAAALLSWPGYHQPGTTNPLPRLDGR